MRGRASHLVGVLVGLICLPAVAQFPGGEGPIVLKPQERPDAAGWVRPLQPGTRLTYYSASATVPGALKALTMNDKGDLIDPQTGQRYAMEDRPGAAAEGFEQYTLVGANEHRAVFDHRMWLTDPTTGPGLTSLETVPLIATPTQGIDHWIPPAVLEAMPDQVEGPTRVGRLQFVHGGKAYRALRVSTYDPKMRSFRTYDLETGILLQLSIASEVARTQKVSPTGQVEHGGIDMMLVHHQLRNVRQVQIPWLNTEASPEVKQLKSVVIQGDIRLAMPAAPGADVVQPLTGETRFERFDGELVVCETRGQKTTHLTATYYIDPQTLAQLKAGQVVDADPVTNVRYLIAHKGAGQIVLREENPRQQAEAAFDLQTGLLLGAQRVQIMGGGTRQTARFSTTFKR